MKKRGKAMSLVLHPTGNKGAGDPSQAAIALRPDGTFTLIIGTADLGQGSNTILRQFAADALDVPIENISVNNQAGNVAPICTGSFASRVTLIDPHAVVNAADDLKDKVVNWAAGMWEVAPEAVTWADNSVFVEGDEEKTMTMTEVGEGVVGSAELMIGTGAWYPAPFTEHDPETGAMESVGAISFGCAVVEVEVDTETGLIDVLSVIQVWELGKAVNPLTCKQQINGGLSVGLGFALAESCHPYYPDAAHAVEHLTDYYVPTFADYPAEISHGIEEVPHPAGVKGAKGFSEGSSTVPISAIISAVHDATGVWITEVPLTPEVVLKALEA